MDSRVLIRSMILAGVSQLEITNAFAASNAVIDANAAAGVAVTKACIAPLDNPFHESRAYAMMHLAIHDALNAIDRKYQPYAYDQKAGPGTSPDAAVAAAAHDVLVPLIKQLPADLLAAGCIDAGVAAAEAAYTAALAKVPDGPAKTQGIALGQASAAATLAKRATDNSTKGPFLNKNCPPAGQPGAYQCTPERPFVAFEPWANVTPFVLQDNTQFRPGPPFPATGPEAKADLDEVKKLGGDGKTTPSSSYRRSVSNRAVLDGKLTAEVEPYRANGRDRQGAGLVAERTSVCHSRHGADRWLHRDGRVEESLQLLAPRHRYPQRR